MMERLKSLKWNHIIEALIMIGIGAVLIFWSNASLVIMARALAVLLILAGAVMVISYFIHKEKTLAMSGGFALGVVVAAIGVWIFLKPDTFTDLIPKLFGVFIFLSGLMNLWQTISLIRYKYAYWWISLILAIITVGLGAFLLFYPSVAKELLIKLIGGFLLYDGISNLWTISRLGKLERAAKQALRDAEAVDTKGEIVGDSAEK
ncbi:hypothetical protein D6855_06050 [Butyrivibrio sp. CB08]|uniref:HdeD family acid-resistance protein n=1 Tax=Butyrivibrio sp. CB08 TaxID=2364879 RepID=UPI000EA907BA|nr:DUF308 domain-containing protein [Butyrivibrio sp. CB08]RKM61452.1 hypothetical protein D6855_06050 [Butyrivibrio sp. CB08]